MAKSENTPDTSSPEPDGDMHRPGDPDAPSETSHLTAPDDAIPPDRSRAGTGDADAEEDVTVNAADSPASPSGDRPSSTSSKTRRQRTPYLDRPRRILPEVQAAADAQSAPAPAPERSPEPPPIPPEPPPEASRPPLPETAGRQDVTRTAVPNQPTRQDDFVSTVIAWLKRLFGQKTG